MLAVPQKEHFADETQATPSARLTKYFPDTVILPGLLKSAFLPLEKVTSAQLDNCPSAGQKVISLAVL